MWVNLEKKNKVRRQGIVRVKIAFSTEKNSQAATQEHRHLLRIFAMHEIEALQVSCHMNLLYVFHDATKQLLK